MGREVKERGGEWRKEGREGKRGGERDVLDLFEYLAISNVVHTSPRSDKANILIMVFTRA